MPTHPENAAAPEHADHPEYAHSPEIADSPFARPSTLPYQLPDYAAIRPEHYLPAIRAGIAEERAVIERIAADTAEPTVQNVLLPLETGSPLLHRAAAAFFTVISSDGTDELQQLEGEISEALTGLRDATVLHPGLFARIDALREAARAGRTELTPEQAHVLERTHQRFVLQGARLDDAHREELAALNLEISARQTEFSQAVKRDMKDAAVHITDEADLAGLDAGQRAAARTAAEDAGLSGWVLTLILPTVQRLLSSLERREVRERLYRASVNRGTGTWDLAAQIARLRRRKAALLGFEDYASLAVADRTAGTPEAVEDLIGRLTAPTMRNVRREAERIGERAAQDGITEIAPWDWSYYADLVRAEDYAVDTAALRPYYVLDRVLEDGVFRAAHEVYGLDFVRREDLAAHHPDARVWEVKDADGTGRGLFIGDFFTRATKRGGAWMNSPVSQSHLLGTPPVVMNNLNISRPAAGEPAFVTLDEVRTLFHEFGHALHGLLSDVELPSASGTSVPRDVVEFPSQVNEMWILDPRIAPHYARHVETGESVPPELLERIRDSELWGEGFRTAEHLAAVVLDWRWHRLDPEEEIDDPHAFEACVLEEAGLAHPLVAPRYRTGYFNHTFSGGYASGYYAYLWAEAFDADTVRWFAEQEEAGRTIREAGEDFRRGILSRGGSVDLLEAYRAFRGHDRDLHHLLARRGLLAQD